MTRPTHRRCAAALALALALATATAAAAAEPTAAPTRPSRPDPLDPRADVPPLRHVSSLPVASRSSAEPTPSWREVNDTVARIGGWRAYAREAQQPDAAASAPSADALSPSKGAAVATVPPAGTAVGASSLPGSAVPPSTPTVGNGSLPAAAATPDTSAGHAGHGKR